MVSNYNKFPSTETHESEVWVGWSSIIAYLDDIEKAKKCILTVECYHGVLFNKLAEAFKGLNSTLFIDTSSLLKSSGEVEKITRPDVTDDELFGIITRLNISDFLDAAKVKEARRAIEQKKRDS